MVILPPQFVATKFPGYFWNTHTQTVYSLKSGELRALPRIKPSTWTQVDGWRVSVKGVKQYLHIAYLKKLDPHDFHTINVVT